VNERYDLRPFDNVSCLLDWGTQGIFALAIEKTNAHIYRIDHLTGKAEQLTPDGVDGFTITEGWIGLGCNFTRDFSRSSFVSYDVEHYAEVTILDLESRTVEHITDFTQGIANWKMGTPEIIRWISGDGVLIEGILTKPDDFKPGKTYPLVVVPHGGPTATSMLPPLVDRDSWNCTIPQLIGKGALILQPNYRGSCGYGEHFQMLNIPEVGLAEYRDIIAGVDALVHRGWADPERVGIVGTSHGGYLALFAAMYNDRFRAAAMLSGIAD
jgi:dipeptidyl aminopeptidase/acylaminoacyl peptidase